VVVVEGRIDKDWHGRHLLDPPCPDLGESSTRQVARGLLALAAKGGRIEQEAERVLERRLIERQREGAKGRGGRVGEEETQR
jgi:hypothetical protein